MHPLTEVTVTTKRPSLIFAVGDYKLGSLFHASFFWGELVWITMFSFKNPFQGRFLLSYHYKGGIKQCIFFSWSFQSKQFPLSYMVWELVSYHEPLVILLFATERSTLQVTQKDLAPKKPPTPTSGENGGV